MVLNDYYSISPAENEIYDQFEHIDEDDRDMRECSWCGEFMYACQCDDDN